MWVCLKSHNLHLSKAGSREFGPTNGLRSVNQRDGAAPVILVEAPWATLRCDSLRGLSLCSSCCPCNAASASRCLSFPSAANESAIGNSTLHSAKDQQYTSSAKIHNVLGPNGTSVDVAGKRAERRGPKTCLQESKTKVGSLWFAARSFGVQLHGNDPAYRRGFGADSGHANSFDITKTSGTCQFLWATAPAVSITAHSVKLVKP